MKTKLFFSITYVLVILSGLLAGCGATSDLKDTSWVLTQINGHPLVIGTQITLSFTDKYITGNASCNNYSGGYEVNGNKLSFDSLLSTLVACAQPGVMEQETAFLGILQSSAGYEIKDGILSIMDASGKIVLVFASQK